MANTVPSKSYFRRSRDAYLGAKRAYQTYWKAYGGAAAVTTSSYFIWAIAVTLVSVGIWSKPDWWNLPISVLPNLIGFTLGGFAILLAFGDSDFLKKLALTSEHRSTGESNSAFLIVSSTFMHFLIVEISGLILAILAMSRPFSSFSRILHELNLSVDGEFISSARLVIAYFGWAVGFLCFIYSIFLSLASAVAIFRLSVWFNTEMRKKG